MYMVCNFFALEREKYVCVHAHTHIYDLMLFVFLLQKDI